MDNRIGIIGGTPPQTTISGLPLPEKPYPITLQLDEVHYVVLDAYPLVDVEVTVLALKEMLSAPLLPRTKKKDAPDDTQGD